MIVVACHAGHGHGHGGFHPLAGSHWQAASETQLDWEAHWHGSSCGPTLPLAVAASASAFAVIAFRVKPTHCLQVHSTTIQGGPGGGCKHGHTLASSDPNRDGSYGGGSNLNRGRTLRTVADVQAPHSRGYSSESAVQGIPPAKDSRTRFVRRQVREARGHRNLSEGRPMGHSTHRGS
jgi:hypothetical protein